MKKFLAHFATKRHAGFTLVELLVVIGIIAILASVVMTIGTTVIKIAKRTKAQNTATQIQTAVLSYYTEYSVYPTPSGAGTGDYMLSDTDAASGPAAGSATWGQLIQCLSGNISPSTGTMTTSTTSAFSNTRSIAFMNLKATDVANSTSGHQDAPLNSLPPTATPTSLYFNIAVDTGYSGLLGSGDSTNGSLSWLPNLTTSTVTLTGGSSTQGVAIWANCNTTSKTTSAWYVHTF